MALELGFDGAGGLAAVLGTIKDENATVDAKGGNQIGILRLISCFVNLVGVIDLLNDVEADGGDVFRLSIAADLAALFIVLFGVGGHGFGYLDLGDL